MNNLDRRAWLVLGVPVAFVVAARLFTASEPLERDLTTYAVVAHEVLEGQPFYTGIWDNKPPGIHTAYGLAELVFGYGPGAVLGLNIAVSLALLLAVFVAAGGRERWQTGCWAAAFWALLSGSIALQANQPNTEPFLNLGLVVAFALATRLPKAGGTALLGVGMGIALGLASLFKQVVVAWLPAVALAHVLSRRGHGPSWRRILPFVQAGASAGALWLLLFVYFAVTGRAEEFVDTLFRYGSYYAGDPSESIAEGLQLDRLVPRYFFFALPLLALVVPAALWGAFRPGAPRRPWPLLLGYLVACPVMVALPQHFFRHYYQLWLPVLAIGLAWLVERIERRRLGAAVAVLTLAYLMVIAVGDYWTTPDAISIRKYSWNFVVVRDLATHIPRYVAEDEKLYHWGFETGYYFYSDRRPASRHLWCHYLKQGPGARERMDEALTELAAAAPPLVVVDTRYCPREPRTEPFFRWLTANYETRSSLPSSIHATFWVRK